MSFSKWDIQVNEPIDITKPQVEAIQIYNFVSVPAGGSTTLLDIYAPVGKPFLVGGAMGFHCNEMHLNLYLTINGVEYLVRGAVFGSSRTIRYAHTYGMLVDSSGASQDYIKNPQYEVTVPFIVEARRLDYFQNNLAIIKFLVHKPIYVERIRVDTFNTDSSNASEHNGSAFLLFADKPF